MDASSTILGPDNTKEVLEVLDPIAARWKRIGITLNLSVNDMEAIDEGCSTMDEKLIKMTSQWLRHDYNTEKYGFPTWPALIKAVRSKTGGRNPALADEIEHKLAESRLIVATKESPNAKKVKCKQKQKLKPSEKSRTKVHGRKASVVSKTSPANSKPSNGSKDQPTPSQATKEQINPAHAPTATTVSSLPRGPHLLVTKACRILLFRISIYLGVIFDGTHERQHSIPVETYKTTKHRATLQIVDSFGPEVREKHETTCTNLPDLVLFCLPLKFDTKVVNKERETFKKVKILLKPEIFERSVIILTIPGTIATSSCSEDLAKQLLGRKVNIDESFARLGSRVTIPPILCIREDLIGDISGCPESSITNFWTTIFERCSRDGQLGLFTYLSDRMYAGHHDSEATSSLLQKIPEEATEKAKSLIGDAFLSNAANFN